MGDKQNQAGKFIVCGATSGFGHAVARALIKDGFHIVAVARNEDNLQSLQDQNPGKVDYVAGDVSEPATLRRIAESSDSGFLHGIFLNSGGPPAKLIEETTLEDWDEAYSSLLKWKVELTRMLLPKFKDQQYGRILFLESASVKQPIENLVLSTSMRLAVVGYAKTLSEEMAHLGITVNVLAPGFHNTRALNRLFEKKSKDENISLDEARERMKRQTKVGFIGDPEKLASLAKWLLSAESEYITGQTISVDGGVIKGIHG
ncbi:MAG: SDR family oxidoreductase [Bacteroidales bacterium]|nr:SDR family oxidoreductase [Bacteroidales bacterium]MBS3775222.1 SDR family oxidoreductase [Bacteroidales bacterium]